jgi:hypothetical protein
MCVSLCVCVFYSANGTVFKAKHKPSGKIIALKRVKIASDAVLHDMQKEISI